MTDAATEDRTDEARRRGARMVRLIIILLLAAAGAILVGVNQTWHTATVTREPPLPPLGASATGADLAPLGLGIGILLLASVVAVIATRTLGRRLVAVVVFAGVVWLGVDVSLTLAGDLDAAVIDTGTHVAPHGLQPTGILGPVLVYLGCLLGLIAAALLWLWAARLPRMGEKYERDHPATPRSEQQEQRDHWRALDRGDDPTV